MAENTYLSIKLNWCKKCNICIEFCPKSVFKEGDDGYPVIDDIKKCTECQICIVMCPEFAILSEEKTKKLLRDR